MDHHLVWLLLEAADFVKVEVCDWTTALVNVFVAYFEVNVFVTFQVNPLFVGAVDVLGMSDISWNSVYFVVLAEDGLVFDHEYFQLRYHPVEWIFLV